MKPIPLTSSAPESVLARAQDLVTGLESGEFIGFAAVAIKRGARGVTTITCGPNVPILTTVGALQWLQVDLLRQLEEQ